MVTLLLSAALVAVNGLGVTAYSDRAGGDQATSLSHRPCRFGVTRTAATSSSSSSSAASSSPRMGELTPPEQKVYDLMKRFHDSGHVFRIVLVGNAGAILETTSALGPQFKLSQSPSTGANLLTMASDDQSFEYHLHLSKVSKIVLVEKTTPKKVMRIVRLLSSTGESISSFILTEEENQAAWFQALVDEYGTEIQL